MSLQKNPWSVGLVIAGIVATQWMLGQILGPNPENQIRASETLLEEKSEEKEFDPEDVKFFRDEIEPVFQDTCQRCHGEKKQESNLRLDSREALLKGGKNGPAIVPGKPDESLLLKVLEYNGDIQMPPDEKLDDETRAAFKKWIEKNAAWPKAKEKKKS